MNSFYTPTLVLAGLILGAAFLPVSSADHGADDAYRCWREDCDWTREDEQRLQRRAQAEGEAGVRPGPVFTRPVDKLGGDGILRIDRDVQRYGQSWEVLAVVDLNATGSCGPIATLTNVSVPGYEDAVDRLAAASGLISTGDGPAIPACGEIYAGLPADRTVDAAGGQLRVQAGSTVDARFHLANSSARFPFWTGVVATPSLNLQRAGSTLKLDLALQVHVLLEGDLGWGSGTVLVDAYEKPYERSIVLAPKQQVGLCDDPSPADGPVAAEICATTEDQHVSIRSSIDAEPIDTGPVDEARSEADNLTRDWVDLDDPVDAVGTCRSLGIGPFFCGKIATLQSLPTIPASRLDAALKESVRVDGTRDRAAEFVRDCRDLDVRACGQGGAGALLAAGGHATAAPSSAVDAAATGAAEQIATLHLGPLVGELECWTDRMLTSASCQGGSP